MTQVATIRRILNDGHTLTQRSALMDHGIMALPRRIADLKETGFPISSIMCRNPTTGQRFAEYFKTKTLHSLDGVREGQTYVITDLIDHPFMQGLEVQEGTRLRIDNVIGSIPGERTAFVTIRFPSLTLEAPQVFKEHRLTKCDFALSPVEGDL